MEDGERSRGHRFRKWLSVGRSKSEKSRDRSAVREQIGSREGGETLPPTVQKSDASEPQPSPALAAVGSQDRTPDCVTVNSEPTQALEATDSAKPPAQAKPFRLEPFKLLHVSSGSGLEQAEKRLNKAFEELEIVLREERPSDKYALDMVEISQLEGDGETVYSFSEIVAELQQHHKDREATSRIRLGNLVASAMPALKLILNVTGTVASNVGVLGPSQIATNGLTQLLDIVMAPNTNADEVLSGLDMSLMDQRLINQLEVLPRHEINEDILRRTLDLQTALIDFLRVGLQWLRHNYVSKIGRVAVGIEKVQDSKSSLQAARDALRTCMSDDMYLEYRRNLLEQRTAEELDRVCPKAENLRHLARQRQELHVQRLPHTAESIIQDAAYRTWGGEGYTTLWCTGLAGAGKTFSASTVIDKLELYVRDHKNIGHAYYFCSFGQRENQNVQSLIGALTRQLIARMQSTANPQIHSEKPTLEDRKRLFKATVAQFGAVYIVIDALDEFSTDHNQRLTLANTLADLSRDSRCYYCITSREADDILFALPNAIKVSVRASEAEIRCYVKYRVQEDEENSYAKGLAKQDPSLVDDLSESVLRKSDRIFRLAELQLTDVLLESDPQAVRDKLEHLASDIDEYYERTMERIDQSKMKSNILQVLSWVFTCKVAINVGQLSVALGTIPARIDENNFSDTRRWLASNVDHYISACEGLLRVQPADDLQLQKIDGSNLVTLAHETVDTFLRANKEKLLPNPNCMILRHSLKFLLGLDLTVQTSNPLIYTSLYEPDDLWDALELTTRRLSRSDWELLSDWAFEEADFPADKRLHDVTLIAMFLVIAEHWGDYAQDAISEDTASVTTIKDFLAAYDKRIWRWNSTHYCALRDWCIPLQLLLDDGRDLNRPVSAAGETVLASYTPIMIALKYRSSAVFQMLLKEKKIDLNAKDIAGRTLLIQCAKSGWECSGLTRARELLCRPEVSLNEIDKDGHTALHWALENDDKEFVDLLLGDSRLKLRENYFDRRTNEATVRSFHGRKISRMMDKRKPGQTLNDVLEDERMLASMESDDSSESSSTRTFEIPSD